MTVALGKSKDARSSSLSPNGSTQGAFRGHGMSGSH